MDFKDRLDGYKNSINDDLANYGQKLLDDTQTEYGEHSSDVLASYLDILERGGKRMRGALVMASYEMVGGSDTDMILKVARAIEMIHASLLVLDDIADKSETRRNGKTAQFLMKDYHQDHSFRGDAAHFGTIEAAYGGILGGYLAEEVIDNLDLDSETKLVLFRHIRQTLIQTYNGQLLDTFNQALPNVSEQDALMVSKLKTSYYSLVSPLELGARLAGAREEDMEFIHRYGQPAGIAYQLSDDIIGIFGDEEKTGKSNLDDLREGKMTILMAHTLEKATHEQREELLAILGNPNLVTQDHETCKQIIISTGALEYAKELTNKYTSDALAALETFPAQWDPSIIEFLRQLTKSFATRQS
jgi:geranylgeranyl pyrophosphate synthase